METEYKYRLSGPMDVRIIMADPLISHNISENSLRDIDMHAVYFDTEDFDLRKAGIAYRLRIENDRITATVKWDAHVNAETGLHEREEVNLVINDERLFYRPNIEIFESSKVYPLLKSKTGGKPLVKNVEMQFNRQLVKINTGSSLSAISFDIGWIDGEKGRVPVNEMEIEWYHGDREDFKKFATNLAQAHDLIPEDASKLQRGFAKNI